MTEHASEINGLLVWVILGGGALFLALMKWIAKQLLGKLEKIEQAIDRTNTTLALIEKDMRNDLAGLDRRVTTIESHCSIFHAK